MTESSACCGLLAFPFDTVKSSNTSGFIFTKSADSISFLAFSHSFSVNAQKVKIHGISKPP